MPDQDIGDLFGNSNQNQEHAALRATLKRLTRQNAAAILKNIDCPFCRATGLYNLFTREPHLGIACNGCGREHPFLKLGLQWLPEEENAWRRRRP
jgi:hypothetical protein